MNLANGIHWVWQHAADLAASGAVGMAGAVVVHMAARLVKNDAALVASLVPAADYWEFVYASVKEAEGQGATGPLRMSFYLGKVDAFLDEAGIQGDARRITRARLIHDAEKVLRELGLNRGTAAGEVTATVARDLAPDAAAS
jgi:hypothetical protein